MWKSILAIALGAALGALLRWFLGLKLNSLLPSIPPRHAAGQPDRRLCHRRGDCLFRPGAGHRSGMAATDHHRVLRRPDHFLHLFRRGRQPASGGPPGLGRRGHRDARQRVVADDPAGVVLDELDAGQIAQREDRPCKAIN
ncbi:hypothetical protein CSC46_4999 [Pseudomonas aeruginosa]|nr:hypothetical protein CSC46_4999 [Pseudomonas aeruginosa]